MERKRIIYLSHKNNKFQMMMINDQMTSLNIYLMILGSESFSRFKLLKDLYAGEITKNMYLYRTSSNAGDKKCLINDRKKFTFKKSKFF